MSPNISFESKHTLFLSIGVVLFASSVSILAQYLTEEQRISAVIIGSILAILSFIYGFKLLGDREKKKDRIEISDTKLRIGKLILMKQQMNNQRDKNIMERLIEDEYQNFSENIQTDIKDINTSVEAEEVSDEILRRWKKE